MSGLRPVLRCLPVLVALALGGCGSTEPRARDVSGTWTGVLVLDNGEEIGVVLTLREGDGGAITGEGVLGPGVFDFELSVDGVHDDPTVSLTLTTTDDTEFVFLGEWAGEDRLEGRVGGALGGDLLLTRD